MDAKIVIRKLLLGFNKGFFKKIKKIWSRGLHFSPSLPGDKYRKSGSESGHLAEILGNFVRYDVLRYCAPFLVCMLIGCSVFFVYACAGLLELNLLLYSWNNIHGVQCEINNRRLGIVFIIASFFAS